MHFFKEKLLWCFDDRYGAPLNWIQKVGDNNVSHIFFTCTVIRRSTTTFTTLHCCHFFVRSFIGSFLFFLGYLNSAGPILNRFANHIHYYFELFMKEIKTCLIFNRKLWIVIIHLFMGDETSLNWDDEAGSVDF